MDIHRGAVIAFELATETPPFDPPPLAKRVANVLFDSLETAAIPSHPLPSPSDKIRFFPLAKILRSVSPNAG
jgi:hypothetical protein